MSRINSNISALQAIHRLHRNHDDLALRLQRLSTGLRINTGKDAPAGLIASETLRSEIGGIQQAVSNSQRAGHVVNTAEGALSEVSALLLEIQSLTVEAANSGAMSPEEVRANQLQVDAILNSINRIANTTQFNGRKLLDGSLDYITSGVDADSISDLQIHAAKLPEDGALDITVGLVQPAEQAIVSHDSNNVDGELQADATLDITGNLGTHQLSFTTGTTMTAMAAAINAVTDSTGVEASVTGEDDEILNFLSGGFGGDQFVRIDVVSGSFSTVDDATEDFGVDAEATINGMAAVMDGLTATIRTGDLDLSLTLSEAFATDAEAEDLGFSITGGGARFQIGSEVNAPGQVHIGVGSVASSRLGSASNGYLATLATGGENSLLSGNHTQAQRIMTEAIRQVAHLRGRLGAFQKNVLESNINSLSVALENVTASESTIRDADFASETAELTRAQILVQANTSVLAQANAVPHNVLALLA